MRAPCINHLVSLVITSGYCVSLRQYGKVKRWLWLLQKLSRLLTPLVQVALRSEQWYFSGGKAILEDFSMKDVLCFSTKWCTPSKKLAFTPWRAGKHANTLWKTNEPESSPSELFALTPPSTHVNISSTIFQPADTITDCWHCAFLGYQWWSVQNVDFFFFSDRHCQSGCQEETQCKGFS